MDVCVLLQCERTFSSFFSFLGVVVVMSDVVKAGRQAVRDP